MKKKVIATTSLSGCFGCHMSILDIDDRILELVELVEFNKSPINDIKHLGKCDIGLIEGGCGNTENVKTLKEFREKCTTLVSVGECAIMGGLPALRNNVVTVAECLQEAYLNEMSIADTADRLIPDDDELPMILDRVVPCHEIVKIDYFLPGCPPNADLIWEAIVALAQGTELNIPYSLIKYD